MRCEESRPLRSDSGRSRSPLFEAFNTAGGKDGDIEDISECHFNLKKRDAFGVGNLIERQCLPPRAGIRRPALRRRGSSLPSGESKQLHVVLGSNSLSSERAPRNSIAGATSCASVRAIGLRLIVWTARPQCRIAYDMACTSPSLALPRSYRHLEGRFGNPLGIKRRGTERDRDVRHGLLSCSDQPQCDGTDLLGQARSDS